MENPNLESLTPEQMVEYIEIFYLECDKTTEQILSGEEYTITASEETADLLFRINFFTNGLHGEVLDNSPAFPVGSIYPLNHASKEFREIYINALDAKIKYTGYLTAHWRIPFPFLRLEHVEFYPAEMYWFYKNIPDEILRRVYIDVDGMPLMQYIDLMENYCLGWDKGPWIEFDGTGSVIKRENFDLVDEETPNFIRRWRRSSMRPRRQNYPSVFQGLRPFQSAQSFLF